MTNQAPQTLNFPCFLVDWIGLTGRKYTLETHPMPVLFRPLAGVYLFCKPANNGKWDAIYVGETDNFNRRLNDQFSTHNAIDRLQRCLPTHIGVLYSIPDRSLRLHIESDLRNSLKPPCNMQ